jgi:hypothetical protein
MDRWGGRRRMLQQMLRGRCAQRDEHTPSLAFGQARSGSLSSRVGPAVLAEPHEH